jgi:type IV secretory pathway TraG/TraD family ATPase VirD4
MRTNQHDTFKGFELFFAHLQMRVKMVIITVAVVGVVHLLLAGGLSFFFYGDGWSIISRYVWLQISHFRLPDLMLVQAGAVELFRRSYVYFALSGVVWLTVPLIFSRYKRHAEEKLNDKHIRGVRLISPAKLQQQVEKGGRIHIGPVVMPANAEVKHCFVVGRPGTGKTVVMRQVIEGIRRIGAKAIVYDFKGDYLSSFYDPNVGDLIFNPLDTRSVGWNLFSEIETTMDIDSISTSLIQPSISNSEPFWNDAARDVFAGLLRVLWASGARTNKDIWAAITAPAIDIAKWLRDTPGGERGFRYVEGASSKQTISVLSVLMQFCKSFQFLAGMEGNFSLKRWVEDPTQKGIMFVTSYADIADSLRPILSLMVDLVGRKLISMPNDYSRRLFFVIDEFGTLQRLSTIQQLLTLARSKGGSVWLGIQDIGQVDKLYGKEGRQTIVNACGSSVMMAVSDPDTARFLSDKIGEREYSSVDETLTMGVENERDGISAARKHKTDKLILSSELTGMPDLTAFLRMPGMDVAKISIAYREYPVVAPSFVMRGGLTL